MAQWVMQNSGTLNSLYSVCFTDENKGFVCGAVGTILKTTDGGGHWELVNSGTSSTLYAICFTTADTGYAIGENGLILMTPDAGDTWMELNSGTSANLVSLHFADRQTGYASAADATVRKTTNGGQSWSIESAPAGGSIWATDSSTIFLVGYGLNIFRSTDGAGSWEILQWNSMGNLNDICFRTPAEGITVGGSWAQGFAYSVIEFTSDSGAHWNMFSKINSNYLNGVCYADSSLVYAVGNDGLIFHSADFLHKWEVQNSGTPHSLYAVHFPTRQTGYIVGDSGTILKTVNGGVGTGELFTSQAINLYPNPSHDYFTFLLPDPYDAGRMSITGISGNEVMKQWIVHGRNTINVKQLASGFYLVRIESGNTLYHLIFIKD